MQQSLLDSRHVELLAALRRSETLAEAADRLAISASAASHRLGEAERRLGIELTEPFGRRLRLTAAGRHLADVAAEADRALAAATETARWMAAATRPAVRIALDFHDTAPWFESLAARPDLPTDVDFIRVAYGTSEAAVRDRRVDLAVELRPGVAAPGAAIVATDELVGVVRADSPAARRGRLLPDDVAESTYATAGDRPEPGFEHHEFFQPAGVRPARLRKVESAALVLRMIRRFGGVTIQPALTLVEAPLRGLAVVPLDGPTVPVHWQAIRRPGPDELVDPLLRSLIEHVRERRPPAAADRPR